MKKDFHASAAANLPIEYAYNRFISDENSRLYDWETWEGANGKILYVSPSCEKISGYMADEFVKDRALLSKIIVDEDKYIWEKHREDIRVNRGSHIEHFRIKNKNGNIVWIEHTCSPVIASGIFLGYKGNNRDITQLKQSEEKYRLLFENSLETIMVIQDKKIKISNPIAEILTGYSREELLEMSFLDLVYEDDLDFTYKIYERGLHEHKNGEKIQLRIVRKNGEVRWIESYGIQYMWNDKIATLSFSIDITERKKVEDELKASEEKYRFITEYVSDVIWVYNVSKYKISYMSPAVYQLRGYTVEEAINQKIEDMLTPQSLKIIKDSIEENTKEFIENPENPKCYIDEIQQPCKNGQNVWVEVSTKYRYNADGDIEIVGISRNIDERKKIDAQIRYLSYYDQLTGLYNRRFYEEELERINTEENLPITLVMADVNGLKLTNDAFGHAVGDKLLKQVSEILKKEADEEGIVARTGGDEFVILLPKATLKQGEALVDKIRKSVNETKMDEVILSISFGFATKTNISEDMENIFTEAENFMYRKKLLESKSMKSETIKLITKSLYEKDFREEDHCQRVSNICKNIGLAMGLPTDEINDLGILGLLHDIGKICVNEKTLNKKGRLSNVDWVAIKRHPEIGYQILRSVNEFAHIAEYVLCHHERPDGNGYPRGLKDHQIPLHAKILSVAEAYDCMININGYKKNITKKGAIKELLRNAGTQFDEEVVKVMVKMLGDRDVG